MRVFIPVTDQMLGNSNAIVQAKMVPFSPEFLRTQPARQVQGSKPENWISKSDYASARRRLRENSNA
ncbi:MAG: hypothetical protein CMQ17_02905 [Gammaproteobacteria bacterium]|jgi:hypothetical protein|nr:hypothetical protein [Gammaproteobacteria bacterium]